MVVKASWLNSSTCGMSDLPTHIFPETIRPQPLSHMGLEMPSRMENATFHLTVSPEGSTWGPGVLPCYQSISHRFRHGGHGCIYAVWSGVHVHGQFLNPSRWDHHDDEVQLKRQTVGTRTLWTHSAPNVFWTLSHFIHLFTHPHAQETKNRNKIIHHVSVCTMHGYFPSTFTVKVSFRVAEKSSSYICIMAIAGIESCEKSWAIYVLYIHLASLYVKLTDSRDSLNFRNL